MVPELLVPSVVNSVVRIVPKFPYPLVRLYPFSEEYSEWSQVLNVSDFSYTTRLVFPQYTIWYQGKPL